MIYSHAGKQCNTRSEFKIGEKENSQKVPYYISISRGLGTIGAKFILFYAKFVLIGEAVPTSSMIVICGSHIYTQAAS